MLAAAAGNAQLEVEQLRQLVREESEALVDGRRRAAASIAIQLRDRLEDAVVLTHSASATVREALLRTPPERVICTASEPYAEGRPFAQELREEGLDVELVEDEQAPRQLEWASLLLLGADTVFRCGTLCNKVGTRALAEAAAMVDLSAREWWLFAPIALAVFWMGLYPESFIRPIRNDVGRILTRLDTVRPTGDSHLTLGMGAHAHLDMEEK